MSIWRWLNVGFWLHNLKTTKSQRQLTSVLDINLTLTLDVGFTLILVTRRCNQNLTKYQRLMTLCACFVPAGKVSFNYSGIPNRPSYRISPKNAQNNKHQNNANHMRPATRKKFTTAREKARLWQKEPRGISPGHGWSEQWRKAAWLKHTFAPFPRGTWRKQLPMCEYEWNKQNVMSVTLNVRWASKAWDISELGGGNSLHSGLCVS